MGEPKVCENETPESLIRQYFSVCRPPSKWEVETPIYSENRPKNMLSHVPRHVCAHGSGRVTP